MARNHGPRFGCTSALGFCLKKFLCFSAKQDSFRFKQHFHKPLLICALEKCIFVPKHHLVCEITKGQSCFSACAWIWVQQDHISSGLCTCIQAPVQVLCNSKNELPVLLDTRSQMKLQEDSQSLSDNNELCTTG